MWKCFQSLEGCSVGVVLHSLQSRSNGWHATLGLWGPWHTMGLPISFGQIATHSILIPLFLWISFLQCPKGEDGWCTFVGNRCKNVRTTTWISPWHLCLGAQWVCPKRKYLHQASISHNVVRSGMRVLPPLYPPYW
jgi:hypothetical protein